MDDLICYKCKKGSCLCDCVNCGEPGQMIYATFPVCVTCFGIFLSTGKTPDPDAPVEIATKPKNKKKRSRKQVLKEFLQEHGWTKAQCRKVLDSIE